MLARSSRSLLLAGAALFALPAFGLSFWRWWTFQYQTFDLAFYVQALWLTVHGHSETSLLGVSLLGNHAEPIIYLLLPLFALCPHPMLLPAIQVAALATMPFTAYRIAHRFGNAPRQSLALALATLLAPASGYVAIHEFHPEALTAPLLLLLYEARQTPRWRRYLVWFGLTLACKENVALLLVAWSAVHAWVDRRCGWAWQLRWNLGPGLAALAWLGLYALVLSPALNGGRVDYGNLYSGLGNSAGDALGKFFTEPHRFWGALWLSVRQGNLLWGMILSTAGLVLLRPRWLLIASPLLLQHLLSWRGSEWSIYFHYAAPLVPLFWLGAAEACAWFSSESTWVWAPAAACVLLQPFIGPVRELHDDWITREQHEWNRSWKAPLVEELARHPEQSVVCGMPYLSHLAKRRELHSLHLVIKGIQTLSHQPYEPQYRPDVVLLDYADTATFNRPGAYYHPRGVIDGRPLPSSDELLNSFLTRDQWHADSWDEVTILRRGDPLPPEKTAAPKKVELFPHTSVAGAGLFAGRDRHTAELHLSWEFHPPRTNIPWVRLNLRGPGGAFSLLLGMGAPEAYGVAATEVRGVRFPPWMPAGRYEARVVFFDQIRAYWGKENRDPYLGAIDLGEWTVE